MKNILVGIDVMLYHIPSSYLE